MGSKKEKGSKASVSSSSSSSSSDDEGKEKRLFLHDESDDDWLIPFREGRQIFTNFIIWDPNEIVVEERIVENLDDDNPNVRAYATPRSAEEAQRYKEEERKRILDEQEEREERAKRLKAAIEKKAAELDRLEKEAEEAAKKNAPRNWSLMVVDDIDWKRPEEKDDKSKKDESAGADGEGCGEGENTGEDGGAEPKPKPLQDDDAMGDPDSEPASGDAKSGDISSVDEGFESDEGPGPGNSMISSPTAVSPGRFRRYPATLFLDRYLNIDKGVNAKLEFDVYEKMEASHPPPPSPSEFYEFDDDEDLAAKLEGIFLKEDENEKMDSDDVMGE